jgi:hypothetical protein
MDDNVWLRMGLYASINDLTACTIWFAFAMLAIYIVKHGTLVWFPFLLLRK